MTSPRKQQISAVLFDYGMVLSGPPDPMAWSDMLRITGFSEEALQSAYWEPRHAYDQGHLTGRAYWERVTGSCKQAITSESLDQLNEADIRLWTQLNTPMIEWAQHLQRKGIKTGILSNLGDDMAAGVIARFPWLGDFDHCTWSHTLRIAKPDPAIYHHAASALATPPSGILFVDDKAENIAAAEIIGMTVIHYSSHQAFLQSLADLDLAHLTTTFV